MDKTNLEVVLRGLGASNIQQQNEEWVNIKCPLAKYTHEKNKDNRPSFGARISNGESTYCNCFACGFRGSLLDLVNSLSSYTKKNYADIRKLIDEKDVNLELPEFENLKKIKVKKQILKNLPTKGYENIFISALKNKEAIRYLIKRKISKEAVKLLDLRFDEQESRILFPVKDREGNLFGFTGRSIYTNPIKIKDYLGLKKSKLLLGEHLYQEGKPIILVEGLFALASLISRGILEKANVVASMGKSLDMSQVERLINLGESVFILYDPDKAGREGIFGTKIGDKKIKGAMQKLINHLPVFIPYYPKDVEDPDNLSLEQLTYMLEKTKLFNNTFTKKSI